MSVIPRALENPSLDGGFWQIRTFAATWLTAYFGRKPPIRFNVLRLTVLGELDRSRTIVAGGRATVTDARSIACFDTGGQVGVKRDQFV